MTAQKQYKHPFDGFRKRSGDVVSFEASKIEQAVRSAVVSVGREHGIQADESLPERVTERVIRQLDDPHSEYYVAEEDGEGRIPRIEDVQDLVEILLAEENESLVVAAYKRYRKQRERARKGIRVRGRPGDTADVTDASLLLVESPSRNETLPWDRERIVDQIVAKTELSRRVARSVAKSVENRVIDGEIRTISTALIRELVNNELADRGHTEQLHDLSLYRVSKDYVRGLMNTKSTENSNIVNNNPEAVNLGIAELVLKQWALDTIFSPELRQAHHTGRIHLHDLGYPHRVYCSSHSIEYVKKYGLQGLVNLNTESRPARTASVLTGHLNTFLASMQANYAGALGIAYINIMYAPFLEGMDRAELKQIAQELIFNGSQNAFSRGGQTLFLDFNIHTGVPRYLKDVPAVGPGGRYMLRRADGSKVALVEEQTEETDPSGYPLMELYVEEDGGRRLVLRERADEHKGLVCDDQVRKEVEARGEKVVTYGDYIREARDFCDALLEVFGEGDRNGRVFEFPKCDFHISDETFEDPEQYRIFMDACRLASENGSTYFIFDRDEVTLSACCRLRTTIDDNRMLRHPESMRFCGFQNVTINIPQAAYRAARRDGERLLETFFEEIDQTMDLAVEAHLQKKRKAAEMLAEPGRPLWQIGKPSCDGKPYVNLETCTYILGLIGVNDAVKFLIGQELHDSNEARRLGLRIVAHMYLKAKKLSQKHGLKFSLEESPAESAARRLAKSDLIYYRDEAKEVVKGDDEDVVYYTNSIHLAADAPVTLVDRIREQSKYHSLIESGAITHAFVGEERPAPESVAALMKKVFFETQSAQVTISPEFTYCNYCRHNMRGLKESCESCGSEDVVGETRVVGYFSKIQNWNKSKRYGELVARQRGQYAVETAEDDAMECAEEPSPQAGAEIRQN
ncbi:anaerobic ribonucleoside-triphosphate reductase [Kiritimatiella glycovorans]|uniref:Anaerobic ribonucleoside-triphosphate reductase n=1 Tax=Kiritimatiella glycovorans TaxID=1307763 RepID=A0A0G3EDN7_9BACT|nr:anaerobic ribonucleoside-triphosphate reductase [Kiritimatiella glycovorans]AKJ64561.1 Anaerobic ribonucleoside-triphosphate reductase [Kiritimatiella glycovorans]